MAGAVETTPEVQGVLMSPRVPKARQGAAPRPPRCRDAPREFVLFLQAVVKRGRQQLLRQIGTEYHALLDLKLNRIRAGVTLARSADEALRQQRFGRRSAGSSARKSWPSFSVDPEILGGAIVRVGERIHDGSVRRRMTKLRRALLTR